jgi:C4-dicarboxylate-specific signal transduction histidine kinase
MHQNEIALWGKITAGITHEMKNVLAIINESNGLIEDIMKAGKKAPIKYQDKLLLALDKINRQINRGVEISNALNKFAHSTDEARARADINEVSSQVSFLLKRFAGQKQVELEILPSESNLNFNTHPFRLILTLTGILYHLLDKIEALMKITLKPGADGENVHFEITLQSQPGQNLETMPGPDQFSFLSEAMTELGADLQASGQTGLIITIPKSEV